MPDGQRRNREEQVIDAAIDVFWRKGFAAASVQDIADAVGVRKGSLYHYIDSKEGLLFRIFDASHQRAVQIMDEVRVLDGTALDRLRMYLIRYVVNYIENFQSVGLYYREWRFVQGDGARLLRSRRRAYDTFISGLLADARDAGDVPPETDVKLATYFMMAAINGIADWYRPGGTLSAIATAEWYADTALDSVRAVARPYGQDGRKRPAVSSA